MKDKKYLLMKLLIFINNINKYFKSIKVDSMPIFYLK